MLFSSDQAIELLVDNPSVYSTPQSLLDLVGKLSLGRSDGVSHGM